MSIRTHEHPLRALPDIMTEPSTNYPVIDFAAMREKLRTAPSPPERHNLLYPDDYWQTKKATVTRTLARQATLRCQLNSAQHRLVHRVVPYIPPLAPSIANYVLEQYQGDDESAQRSLAELMGHIVLGAREFSTDRFEHDSAKITYEALRMQAEVLPVHV